VEHFSLKWNKFIVKLEQLFSRWNILFEVEQFYCGFKIKLFYLQKYFKKSSKYSLSIVLF